MAKIRTLSGGHYFCLLALLFWLRHFDFLVSPYTYPFHDTLIFGFSSFVHFALSLAHGFGFPQITLGSGGADIGVASISMAYFSPQRIIGYFLYLLFPLSPLSAFKLSILLGSTLNGLGWYLFLRRILPSQGLALFAVFLFFCSGIPLVLWHEDQVLTTLSYVPWIFLCLVSFYQTGKGLSLAFACVGCALTIHYPHIHLIMGLFLLISFFIFNREILVNIFRRMKMKKAFVGGILFLMAVSPLLYVKSQAGFYGSPMRSSAQLEVSSLEEYIRLGHKQLASADEEYLLNLLQPSINENFDLCVFFITRLGAGLAILGFLFALFKNKKWRWLCASTVLSGWACFGLYGYLPQILFLIKFPGISAFRQWYHFAPYFIMGLILLSCLGLESILQLLARSSTYVKKLSLALILLFIAAESQSYFKRYQTSYVPKIKYTLPRFSEELYLEKLNKESFNILSDFVGKTAPLVARKENMSFFKDCRGIRERVAWSATNSELSQKDLKCNDLNNLEKLDYPEVLFTPNSVRVLNSKIRPESSILLNLNSNLLDETSLLHHRPLAGSALTIVPASMALELTYKRSFFYFTLSLQFLALAFSVLSPVTVKVPSVFKYLFKKFPAFILAR